MSPLATFLYARPTFLEGLGRVFDLAGTLDDYNRSLSGEQADYLALYADWRLIGMDIQRAMLASSVAKAKGTALVEQQKG